MEPYAVIWHIIVTFIALIQNHIFYIKIVINLNYKDYIENDSNL